MRISKATLLFIVLATTQASSLSAFQPPSLVATSRKTTTVTTAVTRPLQAIAVDDLATTSTTPAPMDVIKSTATPQLQDPKNKNYGAMPNLDGIAFSGLKGQALSWTADSMPKASELRAVIPKDCFEPDTATSLGYLTISLTSTGLCCAIGCQLYDILPVTTNNPLTWPLWMAYAAVTGTVAMGNWVLAHECGHGSFSKNKMLQDAVGYTLHSLMLVPYFSWQRSHAVHHQYTNHMELGETHVPEIKDETPAFQARSAVIEQLGPENGTAAWGALQSFLHLIIGWPAYLMIGATGGADRGMTNHFYPSPLTTPKQPKKELFPGNWKEKVYQSDIGIAAVVGGLAAWTALAGPAQVMALYGGPLLVINAWLVLYTWLQHTDTDVPHFSNDEHTFVRGALHTIDRPYDKLDPWGVIDFLHHKIGTTHVAHHFDSTIPHYKAQAATDAIKEHFPEYYLHDPTPIPQALWRVAKGCTAVEKRGNMWIWNNKGIEDQVEVKQDDR